MRINTKEIVIVFILIIVAFVRYVYFLPTPSVDFYDSVGKEVSFTGMVSDYPDKREGQVRLTVTPENFDFNIVVPVYESSTEFHYGDILEVRGLLTLPESFDTNTGKEFNYPRYLLSHDTFFILKRAEVAKIGENGNFIKKFLFSVREKFETSLDRVLPYTDAGFMKGLLLGDKGGISSEDKDAFAKTGTIHIVALSGFNVMIVAEAVLRTLSIFAVSAISYTFAGIAILLFVILSGASSTAVRAGLMAIIAIIARSTGRTNFPLRALTIVSLLMLAFAPRIIFDVSFHLSVLATFGIIVLPTKIVRYFRWVPAFRGFREMIIATASATIMVIPYIMFVMGSLSLVTLVANAFVLPLVSYLMFFGFVSGILGLLHPSISMPFAFIAHIMTLFIFAVVHFFASLPFASVNITNMPLVFVLAIYAFIIWRVFIKNKNPNIKYENKNLKITQK